MALEIKSGASSDIATVDATSKALRASLYDPNGNAISRAHGEDVRSAEFLLVGGNNDGNAHPMRMDRFGSVGQASITPLLHEPFEGTTLSASRLLATATTMAAAQTALGLTINSAAITTINTGYLLSTRKHMPRMMRAPIQAKVRLRPNHQNNAVAEWGFGAGNTATASPTVGAYFQVTAAGVMQPVLSYNSVDITGSAITFDPTKYYTFDVLLDDDSATFVVQDTSTGLILNTQTLYLPLTQGRLSNVTHLPAFVALRNTGVAPASPPSIIVTDLFVGVIDSAINAPWASRAAQMGAGANYSPTAFTQTSNGANSTAPTAATLSNTAAGYTTLGGRFGFAAANGAVTDYSLFAFAVPSPYQLVITGVDIDTYNTGAAVATTPTLLDWSIGVNGASANLSTGGFIRDFIGAQSFAVGAAVGAKAERISMKFDAPLVCEAGLTAAIILRLPVGTATASQVVQGGVKVHGYFE